jgi:hypothetical protein
MYQLLLTKKRKGSNFCVKEELQQYSNSSSHSSTSLVCGPVATHKAGGIVYFEGKEEGYLLFNSVGGILSLFVGVRPLLLFKEYVGARTPLCYALRSTYVWVHDNISLLLYKG